MTADAKEAIYCPADDYSPTGVEPAILDPLEGNQGLGCGPESPLIQFWGSEAIPYDTTPRDDYDWTYEQPGEQTP